MESWPWPHFLEHELVCKHCGIQKMDAGFMERLETLRVAWGRPIALTSAYRCAVHNQKVSDTGPHGPHTTGHAVDVRIYGIDVVDLMCLARALGFTRFFAGQKIGTHYKRRILHIDDLPATSGRPSPFFANY